MNLDQIRINNKAPNKVPNKVPSKVPDKLPDKVPNKSELAILKLLSDNPRLTRRELTAQDELSENGIKVKMA